MLKKELLLTGLDCAHCSAEIQEALGRIDPDVQAQLNFVTRTLRIESDHPEKTRRFLEQAEIIIHRIEPGVRIVDRSAEATQNHVLLLIGLDCAHCATLIEKEVSALAEVREAAVDFTAQKLFVTLASDADPDTVLHTISGLVTGIEPGVEVQLPSEGAVTHDEGHETRTRVLRLGGSLLLFLSGLAGVAGTAGSLGLFLTAYLLAGYDVLWKAVKNTLRGRLMDENFLMALATIGALALRQYPEAVAVMVFYQLGELFQHLAVNKSRRSIKSLLDIQARTAVLITETGERTVDPESVQPGSRIRIRPGERVPLDGILISGETALDLSALTGESIPREVTPGDDILSGAINQTGVIEVEVSRPFRDSTVSRILNLVEGAASRKAPTEQFITRFARYYTPAVVAGAALVAILPPLLIQGATFETWLYRALVFLVISCPCALVISIPLGFFGGIGAASRAGILIKGSNYLEGLHHVDTVIFDKTGTLTEGRFAVTEIHPAASMTSAELLEIAAHVESWSSHPIARGILNAWGKPIDSTRMTQMREIPGKGLTALLDGKNIAAGNAGLLNQLGIAVPHQEDPRTQVLVAVEGQWAGTLILEDTPKADAVTALNTLKQLGVRQTVMLTGDSEGTAQRVAQQLGITRFFARLLPAEKVDKLEQLMLECPPRKKTVFVGDGINDAPVLARADIGIAMGALGSDAAVESADIVLMTDEPAKVAEAIQIARETRHIVLQNIFFALTVKAVVLMLGAGGLATLWEAVFADVGVALIAILNAMRLINRSEKRYRTAPAVEMPE